MEKIPDQLTWALPEKPIFSIDTTNACNLFCKCCSRGQRYEKNTKDVMSYKLFTSIIEKIADIGASALNLFVFTEPFLQQNLLKFASYAKSKSIANINLSSNLSFPEPKDFIKTLGYIDKLIVSVSGFSQKNLFYKPLWWKNRFC